jgi:hypothetical protein
MSELIAIIPSELRARFIYLDIGLTAADKTGRRNINCTRKAAANKKKIACENNPIRTDAQGKLWMPIHVDSCAGCGVTLVGHPLYCPPVDADLLDSLSVLVEHPNIAKDL